jgi:hypothetical protein
MIGRSEDEPEVVLLDAGAEFCGGQLQGDTEFFEDIGTATLGGDGAVTMFDDGNSAGGEDEHHGGGDVEELEFVATGAADIEHGAADACGVDAGIYGACEHGASEGGDLGSAFAFVSQRLEKVGLVPVGNVRRDKLGDGLLDLVGGEVGGALEIGDESVHSASYLPEAAAMIKMRIRIVRTRSAILIQLNGCLPAMAPV